MAYDSVLDREMFRPKSRGVVSLDDTETPEISEDLRNRREQAMAMMEASKEKFDPKNFQTLTEQDRPGVFRPVAVNMPAQQQTATTAQRMQQMANMGMRPVGMARGGMTEDFYSSPYERSYDIAMHSPIEGLADRRDYALPSYDPETMAPTISSDSGEGIAAIDLLSDEEKARATEIRDAIRAQNEVDPESFDARMANLRAKLPRVRAMDVKTPNEDQPVEENKYSGLDLNDPKLWTDEQIDEVAKRFPGNEEGTAAGLRSERQMALDTADRPMPVIKRSRETLRPERSFFDLNIGNEAERKQRELTEKTIEKRAKTPPPRVVPSGQFVRPEYARPLTPQELAVKKASEEGIAVATPGAVVTLPAAAPSSEDGGVASLVGSGRGAVERPGERAAYARSRAEGTLPSGTKTPDTGIKAVGAAKEHSTNMYDIKRDREDAFNMALMMAGLGMMSGKSSNALANIGEGGIMGLKAYADQLSQSRARALEDRKMDMMEKYYGSREKALAASEGKNAVAVARLQLDAEQAAAKEVTDMLKSDPTLAQDKKRLQLIREEARNRYISTIMDTSSMTAAAAPDLNASAEPLF